MEQSSRELKAKKTSFLHFPPQFQVIGCLTDAQRHTLRLVEDLFFIKFVETNDISFNKQRNLSGRIIFFHHNIEKYIDSKYFQNIKLPNLILNISEANAGILKTLINVEIRGTALKCQEYYINSKREVFGVLRGFYIKEKEPRNILAFAIGKGIENLIASKDSWIFGQLGNTYISTVGLPDIYEKHGIRDEFNDLKFMGLLPLFFFLRECLGDQSFKPVNNKSCCMIDDPNLRFLRYGYMKYPDIVKSARLNNYHVSIAIVPIDYKKIGSRTLSIFQKNKNYLSVVMHGNDHLRNEMLVSLPVHKKTAMLEQALWRMNWFANKTNLQYAAAMVLPNDRGSMETIKMMRRTGYRALFKYWAYPTDMGGGDGTPYPLFEMFPSENTIEGFPIINRQSIEAHRNREHNWYHKILFHAWLGKPIIPFTHHYFFKNGIGDLEERVTFINRHISPEWSDITGILNGNYTIALRNGIAYINIHSNVLKIDVPENVSEIVLIKCGRDLPIHEETLLVNGSKYNWNYKSSQCLSSFIKIDNHRVINLEIIPRTAQLGGKKHVTNIRAYLRRYLTELRDQTEPYFKWRDEFVKNNVFKK